LYTVTGVTSCRLSRNEAVEFDPITVDSIFDNEPIKRQICITLNVNNRKTPVVKSLITWLAGRRLLKHQLNMQVIQNAQGSLPSWKVNDIYHFKHFDKIKAS